MTGRNAAWLLAVIALVCVVIAYGLWGSDLIRADGPGGNELEPDNKSAASSKPTYYYFYTSACPFCKWMEENTLQNETVLRILEANFTFRRVNAGVERSLADKYGIYGVPTNVFTYPNGTAFGKFAQPIGPDDFLNLLEQALEFYAAYSPR